MRVRTMILVAAAAVALCVAVYLVTGGHFLFFALPLLLVLPLRRRNGR